MDSFVLAILFCIAAVAAIYLAAIGIAYAYNAVASVFVRVGDWRDERWHRQQIR